MFVVTDSICVNDFGWPLCHKTCYVLFGNLVTITLMQYVYVLILCAFSIAILWFRQSGVDVTSHVPTDPGRKVLKFFPISGSPGA